MTLSTSMEFNQNTSDNLNPADNTVPLFKKNDEVIRLRERSSIFEQETAGHSFVLGHTDNGVLGAPALGVDGIQVVLGEANRVITRLRVTNPNQRFYESFKFTHFKDTNETNTAYWDTTNLRLAMDSGTDRSKIYNTIMQSSSIFLNSETVVKATITALETKYGNDIIKYFLSADGGQNWQEATIDTELAFTYTGQDLRTKVLFMGTGANETYIEDLQVSYVI